MQRAKIKRQKENLPDEGQQRKIMVASHMVLAATFIQLHGDYGFSTKRCNDIITAYWDTMCSIHSKSVSRAMITGSSVTPSEVMAAAQEFCDEKLVTLPRWMV